jgi:NAD(P)H-dependent FMN reductase
VGYGSAGGVRAVEHLRLMMSEVQVATVRGQVMLSLFNDFENFRVFAPHARHLQALSTMLDQLASWAGALKTVRQTL